MEPYVRLVLVAVAVTAVIAATIYLLLRWLAFRIARRVAEEAEARLSARLATGVARTRRGFPASAVVTPSELDQALAQLDRHAWLMDRVIPLPIIGGVGLDALIGLAPVAGDAISLAISSVLIMKAARLGAPPELLARLIAIQCIDLLLGAVPLVGDLADAGYHANERSVKLIRDWIASVRSAS